MSQKGGVGKSTLARALTTFASKSGLDVTLADLDHQQRTVTVWGHARARHGIKPAVRVLDASIDETMKLARQCDLLIIDTAGGITDEMHKLAGHAHLIVQPTSPSADDMHISVLVFLAMERVGIPRDRLAFALCGVMSKAEERDARAFLGSFSYLVLQGGVPSSAAYREAMKTGRSILETGQRTLNGAASLLISDLLNVAMRSAGK
jgi:chromosome partitioning protein